MAYREANGMEAYEALYSLTEEKAAESYFSGMKTIEEIVLIIENRVQLYLEEKN